MATSSNIEWTNATWNPIVGCRACSSGCAKCYAEVMSKRLRAMAEKDIADGKDPGRKRHYLSVIGDNGKWNSTVDLVPEALADPLKWKKPRRVFVNSMSDLFYGDEADRRSCESRGVPFTPVPFDYVDQVLAVAAIAQRHTFQILTKRPERTAEYMLSRQPQKNGWIPEQFAAILNSPRPELGGRNWTTRYGKGDRIRWPLPNVWLGTSVENQQTADERIPHLLKCPAVVRFLSMEPLLGPLDVLRYMGGCTFRCKCGFHNTESELVYMGGAVIICATSVMSGAKFSGQ